MKLHLISTTLLILISVNLVFAQRDSTALWPVDELCVTSPTTPPDGWTYSGTLLMSGYAGIHAMQSDWETPRVVASYYSESNGDEPIIGGQLSPDGKWFAVPIGETFTEVSSNIYNFAHGVRIYSMSDDTIITSDFSNYSGDYVYSPGAWSYLPVEWADNQSFILGGMLFYPFENHIEDAPFNSDGLILDRGYLSLDYLSPDHKRAIRKYSIGDGTTRMVLYEPDNPAAPFVEMENVSNVVWKRDSSGLIAQETAKNSRRSGLSLFNRDGARVERLIDLREGRLDFWRDYAGRHESQWSPDNSQFAFSFYKYPDPSLLYLLDLEKKQVINTCLNPVSTPVWSPDGKQIAYLAAARENLNVVILDIERWQAYIVARHSGVFGALRPDMIGWRSND